MKRGASTDRRGQPSLFVSSPSSRRHGPFDADAFGARPRAAMSRDSFNGKVAKLFKSRSGEWIDGREIAEIAGIYGWRTRVSEVRRHYGLNIENRQYKRGRYTVSEYRIYRTVIDTPMSVSESQAQQRASQQYGMPVEQVRETVDKVQRALFSNKWFGRPDAEIRHASDWSGERQ